MWKKNFHAPLNFPANYDLVCDILECVSVAIKTQGQAMGPPPPSDRELASSGTQTASSFPADANVVLSSGSTGAAQANGQREEPDVSAGAVGGAQTAVAAPAVADLGVLEEEKMDPSLPPHQRLKIANQRAKKLRERCSASVAAVQAEASKTTPAKADNLDDIAGQLQGLKALLGGYIRAIKTKVGIVESEQLGRSEMVQTLQGRAEALEKQVGHVQACEEVAAREKEMRQRYQQTLEDLLDDEDKEDTSAADTCLHQWEELTKERRGAMAACAAAFATAINGEAPPLSLS